MSTAKFCEETNGEVVDGVSDRDIEAAGFGAFHFLNQLFSLIELLGDISAQLVKGLTGAG